MKRFFAGDVEFGLERYWQLPYTYVIEAVGAASRLQQKELHHSERPVANMTALLYNINRNQKQKALSLTDFCLYASKEDRNLPAGVYGAAMCAARQQGLFPSWGLFVYKELADSAAGNPPEVPIVQCSDVLVLAPKVSGQTLTGFMIVQDSASEQVRELVYPDKRRVLVRVPKVDRKYVASEGATLEILGEYPA